VSKRLEESRWFLATYPTLRYKETWVSPKIRVLPSGTFPNSGLKKFRHGKSIALSTKLVVVVAVYYNSINCNSVTPLLRFAVYLLYNLVDKILTDSASRGPSATAELLVYISVGTTGYSLSNNPRLFKAQQRWAHTTDLLMTMRILLLSNGTNINDLEYFQYVSIYSCLKSFLLQKAPVPLNFDCCATPVETGWRTFQGHR